MREPYEWEWAIIMRFRLKRMSDIALHRPRPWRFAKLKEAGPQVRATLKLKPWT